jgi:probable F420-dependent oxidoreductase
MSERIAPIATTPRFRFGLQVGRESDPDSMRSTARAAEAVGFDVLSTWDHVGDTWPPLSPLHAMAAVTERIRLCPLVLNNDFWHPVHLAREVAAIDRFSGGRFELGIGAGHAFTEYAAIGAPFDPPAVRKRRMAEAIELLRRLLDGETVTHAGEFYAVSDITLMRSAQARVPILVGVNGKDALAHAATHADTIGLTMLGRTLEDGQHHEVRWQADRLDATVAHIAEHAAGRERPLELNALVQVVTITDDRRAAAEALVEHVPSLSVEDALHTPFVLFGTHAQIAEQLIVNRSRWGISYATVRDLEAFAPVIALLADA